MAGESGAAHLRLVNAEQIGTRSQFTKPADNLDLSLDTLADLLKDFGRYGFDIPEMDATTLSVLCEEWAKHVLFATPVSSHNSEVREVTGDEPTGKRDWNGIRTFFQGQRQGEQAFISGSMGSMQEFVWTFLHELNRTMQEDHRTEGRIRNHLTNLQQAAKSNSFDDLKREALFTVASLFQIMEDRKRDQERYIEELYERIRELGTQLEEALQENTLDPLTGLYNRRALDNHLSRTLDIRRIFGEPVCLLLVDADRFKSINDTLGHPAGDCVLKALSDCLTSTFPRKGEFIARYGGEEFAIIFREASLEEGRMLASRLLKAVRAMSIDYGSGTTSITVSIGIAECQVEDTLHSWVERADRALYKAKQNGRDRAEG